MNARRMAAALAGLVLAALVSMGEASPGYFGSGHDAGQRPAPRAR
ncbi:hypothetical protein [Longimicrobium sp.]|nr:hypothetical protein [Longimicrobium sp.]HEX6040409.1 hypothetical protein [Longimicrobium sp.]